MLPTLPKLQNPKVTLGLIENLCFKINYHYKMKNIYLITFAIIITIPYILINLCFIKYIVGGG